MDGDKRMVDEKKEETQYFVFKANVPLNDSEEMLDWTKNCQAKTPKGHSDYRWGKILHDHLFVKKFQRELQDLKDTQDSILELLKEITKTLETKEVKDKNNDLFKG